MIASPHSRSACLAVVLLSGGSLLGCRPLSESYTDDAVGFNGGFEVARNGLPVNWAVYSPRTIPTGDYELVVDTLDYRDGRQSLRFVVRDCSPEGGNRSPGISHERPATPGQTYRVGFWVKNDGAEYRARVGAVSATEGQYDVIVQSTDPVGTWRYYEHEVTVPPGFDRIRFEVNVLRPGVFSIDEVVIDPIA